MSKTIDFVRDNYPYAKQVQKETGIPAIAILAQAALESGWGEKSIGNNIFGIKYKTGDWASQTVLTTEFYDKIPGNVNTENVKTVDFDKPSGKWRVRKWCYFADYPSPREAFLAHSTLLLTDRYKDALRWKNEPKKYLIAIWRAGYATDPNYGRKMCQMVDSVMKRM